MYQGQFQSLSVKGRKLTFFGFFATCVPRLTFRALGDKGLILEANLRGIDLGIRHLLQWSDWGIST
jgi:hypothetical protein